MMDTLKKYWHLIIVILIYSGLAVFMPDKARLAITVTLRTIASVAFIITSVFILIGLFQVWLKEDIIAKKLGHESGMKAIVFSALFGSMLAGPLFAIFPLLKSFLNRGARTGVIVAMLTTWAVKIPMIPLEIKFIGLEFTLIRITLVLLMAIPMSLLMEKIVGQGGQIGPATAKEEAETADAAFVQPEPVIVESVNK